ncbi:MAG: TIGR01458 family HAD-type hydrolase [Marinibacterium sp.]
MIRGVLLDLSGVLYVGDTAVPGAVEAVARLRAAGLELRFLTNSTRDPKRALLARLRGLGFDIAARDVFTPAQAAREWLAAHGHRPHLLTVPELAEDFDGPDPTLPQAVVLGDMGPGFTFDVLNAAFRLLIGGAPFLALAANRTFQDADGELSMDAGAFVAALEYASGVRAQLVGKPAPAFFAAAARDMGLPLAGVAMVGDDAEADIAGALEAGAEAAFLVRTGKYRPGAETLASRAPTATVADLAEAAERIVGIRG